MPHEIITSFALISKRLPATRYFASYSSAAAEAKALGFTKRQYIIEEQYRGVPINPKLPKNFDNTPNDVRPASHQKWWFMPFIETDTVQELDAYYAGRTDEYAEKGREMWKEGRNNWMKAWPTGTRYTARCLDGGAWDRSTNWGMFASLDEAIRCIEER